MTAHSWDVRVDDVTVVSRMKRPRNTKRWYRCQCGRWWGVNKRFRCHCGADPRDQKATPSASVTGQVEPR